MFAIISNYYLINIIYYYTVNIQRIFLFDKVKFTRYFHISTKKYNYMQI